jgi:hypothetical protein
MSCSSMRLCQQHSAKQRQIGNAKEVGRFDLTEWLGPTEAQAHRHQSEQLAANSQSVGPLIYSLRRDDRDYLAVGVEALCDRRATFAVATGGCIVARLLVWSSYMS